MLSLRSARQNGAVAVLSRSGMDGGLLRLDSAVEPADSELARRINRGDRWAEEALYRRYVGQVVSLARRLLRNSADAEDVAQETFITAFDIWSQLRDYERARSWLLQICVRLVHRKFRRRRLLRLLGLDQSFDDLPLAALARDDATAEVRSELKLLDTVLQSLSDKCRIPWMLRYVEGLPLDEVADRCECSRATVKRRLAVAHRHVSRRVQLEEPADE